MKSSLFFRQVLSTLALGLVVVQIGWPQPLILQKFVATPAYLEARALTRRPNDRPKAVEKLLALARANPRTTLGAVCLFDAAFYMEDPVAAQPIYEEISRIYAGTVFDVHARESIFLQLNSEKPSALRFQGREQILASLKAPTLSQILNRPTDSARRIRSLEANYSEAIGELYESQAAILLALGRYDDAIALGKFGAEQWPTLRVGHELGYNAFSAYIDKFRLIRPLSPTVAVPISLRVKLGENERRCGRPLIRGEAFTGDFNSYRISWLDSIVTLDGVDIRPKLNLIYRYPKKLKPGKIFEYIQFSYQPSAPLASGNHVLYVKLMTVRKLDGPVTELTRRFQVDRSIRDDREDSDEDQDRDRKEQRDD